MLKDSYRHKGQRRLLVEELRQNGIRDEGILAAMESLPRHFFMDKTFEEWAYRDKPFPIGNDQTISQPFTVAIQTSLLELQPREKTLEVGTGSGYQAAVLALLGARVFTIERQETLHRRASQLLQDLNFNSIRCFYGDGYKGLPQHAPFHKILVTAGAPEIPPALKQQLKVGGLLVIPVGTGQQEMIRIRRISEHEFAEEHFGKFRFVPLLRGMNRDKGMD